MEHSGLIKLELHGLSAYFIGKDEAAALTTSEVPLTTATGNPERLA